MVDNEIYERKGDAWWSDDVPVFATIRYFINPARFGYCMSVIDALPPRPPGAELLDVGCGGGLLAEEFARCGLSVRGVDISAASIREAARHARQEGLAIDYRVASGDRLPFEDAFFDYVTCCDVLEHVDDPGAVVGEIARVLKPGGVFFYDTINRTLASRIITIGLMQEWKRTAFVPAGTHDWHRFIRPGELEGLLRRHGLESRDCRGLAPRANPVACLVNLRRAASGGISYRELGERLRFGVGGSLMNSYIGYAVNASERVADSSHER